MCVCLTFSDTIFPSGLRPILHSEQVKGTNLSQQGGAKLYDVNI